MLQTYMQITEYVICIGSVPGLRIHLIKSDLFKQPKLVIGQT